VSTVRTSTADEYGVLLHQMMTLHGLPHGRVESAILASVVPPLTDVMSGAIRHAFGREPLVVGPGLKTGISVVYDNPRDVGADRIVNAVAAYDKVRGAVIVVDFGTATTFDCVSAKPEYLGGVIVPGIQVSLDGLLGHAAKLTRVEIAETPHVIGQNTTHAIQSGVINGYASLVDGLVDKIIAELGYSCAIIATGGLAPLIAKHTKSLKVVDENLTLDGLRILHEKNLRADSPGIAAAR
jgi:type III pantothenate kinase